MSLKLKTKRVQSKRDEYHHGDLRAVLIQSAEEILRTEGIDHLTLRNCTKKAGVSPSALAHHFKNLNGLLTAVAVKGFEALWIELVKDLKATRSKKESSLEVISLTYLRFALKNADLYRVMFSPNLAENDPDLARVNQECFAILRKEVVNQGTKDSGLNFDMEAFRFWSLAHGFVLLALADRLQVLPKSATPKNRKELEETFLRYLF